MALLKNRIANNIKKSKNNGNEEYMATLKEKMQQQVKDNLFVDAMDTMAEIAENKMMDIDIMYMGAYCYLMTGDNERAATWINNILSYEPTNARARILLGRLCVMEDREEDGLAVYDFILEKMQDKLSEEDKSDLDELLDYYRYAEPEMIKENYPSIAKFLELEEEKAEVPVVENRPEVKAEPVEENDPAARAKAAVERLRALLKKQKEEDAVSMAHDSEIKSSVEKPVKEKNIQAATQCIDENDIEAAETSVNGFDVASITAKIMESNVSLKEKIKMFNTFAAGCYANGDYQSAFDLLNGALMLDSSDPFVLRNIAYVCIAAGEREQAMEYASKMPMIDFGILHAIK